MPPSALKSEGPGWHAGKSFLNGLACFGCPTDTARSSSKWITKSAHVQTGVPLPQHLSAPSPRDAANQRPPHISTAIKGCIMRRDQNLSTAENKTLPMSNTSESIKYKHRWGHEVDHEFD